ncbi:MAG: hypothetical protein KF832_31700, partial [Caldilineaceae bacterium]|nr:hypothetical protein [Caldilineaceae bacterium]
MRDDKFFLLLVDFLWMVGLFGALFALLYLIQYRRRHRWSTGGATLVPRTLVPLYGALVIFAVGLALHAYVAGHWVALSLAGGWALLAGYLAFRTFELLMAGLQDGWDTAEAPLVADDEEDAEPLFPMGLALAGLVLVVNLGLLAWWGTDQWRMGTLTGVLWAQPQSVAAARPSQSAAAAPSSPANASDTTGSWSDSWHSGVTTLGTLANQQWTNLQESLPAWLVIPWWTTQAMTTTVMPMTDLLATQTASAPTDPQGIALAVTLTVFATPAVTPTVSAALPPTETPLPTATALPTETPFPTATP